MGSYRYSNLNSKINSLENQIKNFKKNYSSCNYARYFESDLIDIANNIKYDVVRSKPSTCCCNSKKLSQMYHKITILENELEELLRNTGKYNNSLSRSCSKKLCRSLGEQKGYKMVNHNFQNKKCFPLDYFFEKVQPKYVVKDKTSSDSQEEVIIYAISSTTSSSESTIVIDTSTSKPSNIFKHIKRCSRKVPFDICKSKSKIIIKGERHAKPSFQQPSTSKRRRRPQNNPFHVHKSKSPVFRVYSNRKIREQGSGIYLNKSRNKFPIAVHGKKTKNNIKRKEKGTSEKKIEAPSRTQKSVSKSSPKSLQNPRHKKYSSFHKPNSKPRVKKESLYEFRDVKNRNHESSTEINHKKAKLKQTQSRNTFSAGKGSQYKHQRHSKTVIVANSLIPYFDELHQKNKELYNSAASGNMSYHERNSNIGSQTNVNNLYGRKMYYQRLNSNDDLKQHSKNKVILHETSNCEGLDPFYDGDLSLNTQKTASKKMSRLQHFSRYPQESPPNEPRKTPPETLVPKYSTKQLSNDSINTHTKKVKDTIAISNELGTHNNINPNKIKDTFSNDPVTLSVYLSNGSVHQNKKQNPSHSSKKSNIKLKPELHHSFSKDERIVFNSSDLQNDQIAPVNKKLSSSSFPNLATIVVKSNSDINQSDKFNSFKNAYEHDFSLYRAQEEVNPKRKKSITGKSKQQLEEQRIDNKKKSSNVTLSPAQNIKLLENQNLIRNVSTTELIGQYNGTPAKKKSAAKLKGLFRSKVKGVIPRGSKTDQLVSKTLYKPNIQLTASKKISEQEFAPKNIFVGPRESSVENEVDDINFPKSVSGYFDNLSSSQYFDQTAYSNRHSKQRKSKARESKPSFNYKLQKSNLISKDDEALNYSLRYTKERHREYELNFEPRNLCLGDINSSNCKMIFSMEEMFSEHKLNGSEVHFHKRTANSDIHLDRIKHGKAKSNMNPRESKFKYSTLNRPTDGYIKQSNPRKTTYYYTNNPVKKSATINSGSPGFIDWKTVAHEVKESLKH